MRTLYIVTGPPGVGKSTVSKKLAGLLEKSALIEGDNIYHQVIGSYSPAWTEKNHLDLFFRNSIDLIENYINYGYDVVFNYIVNKENLRKITDRLHNVDVRFICLMTNEEELLRRDALRSEGHKLKERCIILLNSFRNEGYDSKYMFDNTNVEPEQTALKVMYEDRFILR